MAILPPASALKPLEPRPGGQWAVTGESQDSFSLSYIMDGGAEAVTYTMHQCTTEEDIQAHCGSLLYDYNGGLPNVGPSQQAGHATVGSQASNSPLHLVLRPQAQSQDATAHLLQTIPNASNIPMSHQTSRNSHSSEHGQADLRLENMNHHNQLFYQSHPIPLGHSQPGLPANFNPNHLGWPFGDVIMSTHAGHAGLTTLPTMLPGAAGNPPHSRRLSPASWPENWVSMNDLGNHEPDLSWQNLFHNS